MSRIRSVHPGLFSDGDVVGLSDSAQIFFIGLWTEADDFGAFEWKPITLKIKLRGASTMPVEPLLEELRVADRIRQYEHDGRQYGVIRNFTRFQRPKFPKSQHFIPIELRRFAGSTETITETERVDGPTIPRKAEKPPQMEDGGEDSEVRTSGADAPADPVKTIWDRGLAILGNGQRALLGKLRKTYGDPAVLAAIVSCESECPSEPVAFLVACCERRKTNGKGSAEHDRAVDILGKAGFEFDERQSRIGPFETPH